MKPQGILRRGQPRFPLLLRGGLLVAAWLAAAPELRAQSSEANGAAAATAGEALYRGACASCHGANGAGADPTFVGFDTPLPDFTSCDFATREPDADWIAVAHDGGPVRGFSEMMPAFGDALTDEELQRVMGYIRTLCGSDDWPRGELNLPRPLLTEKAYPEDEAVWSTSVATGEIGAVMNELVYEQRFGARNQFEIAVPFGFQERPDGGWTGAGLGDVALGVKRAVFHDLDAGRIFSVAGELLLPTGDEESGFGKGTPVFEPFVAFGQVLPREAFLHLQGGLEYPFDRDRASEEAFWRGALGMSLTEGRFGRSWSPMLEIVGARELASGAPTLWDIVPQAQVTLNTRQHLMASLGVRLPLNETDDRDPELLVYLLWDWFDGGLLDGW
jgi:mono/diheme cytochrome c family protein